MELGGKTLAITGIGGFIGLRMAERAHEIGMEIQGLDFDAGVLERVRESGYKCFAGDVTSVDDCEQLCSGADVVLNTAATLDAMATLEFSRRINVHGAVNMAEAARKSGARYFVQLSSVMVYGFTYRPYVTEDGPLHGENNSYCQTKIEGERALMALHQPGKFDVIIIRPGDVYGPRSHPWVLGPAKAIREGEFVTVRNNTGIMNHLHVDNLIDGILLALERDAGGETFNLTDGAETTFTDYFAYLENFVGKKATRLPAGVIRMLFGTIDIVCRLRNKPSTVDASILSIFMRPHPYSIEKARTQLGYEPGIGLEEGMEEVRRHLEAIGLAMPPNHEGSRTD
jgi:nucleoside-diphosphate-sugar epimerase